MEWLKEYYLNEVETSYHMITRKYWKDFRATGISKSRVSKIYDALLKELRILYTSTLDFDMEWDDFECESYSLAERESKEKECFDLFVKFGLSKEEANYEVFKISYNRGYDKDEDIKDVAKIKNTFYIKKKTVTSRLVFDFEKCSLFEMENMSDTKLKKMVGSKGLSLYREYFELRKKWRESKPCKEVSFERKSELINVIIKKLHEIMYENNDDQLFFAILIRAGLTNNEIKKIVEQYY